MLRLHPTAANVLGATRNSRIAGIEIHLIRIGNIARHDSALNEMDVRHDINDASDVVEVLNRRFAIHAVRIDRIDGRTRRTEIGSVGRRLQIVFCILGLQRDLDA